MKILVEPINLKNLYELDKLDIGGFIVGLENYSIFQSLKLSTEEIKNIKTNKEIYIYINKPIHNNEIDNLKSNLIEISKLNISGVIFEDISIFNLNKKLNLNINLIWGQMHLPTNSITCNYWTSKGCVGAYLSTELMVSDFINIKKNTNTKIFVNLYGHSPIFESSRELVTNYLKYINKAKQDDIYYLYEKERDKYYTIYEEYGNTFVLDDVINGINELKSMKDADIDYVVLNGLLIDENEFNKVINEYINSLNGNYVTKENTYTGFLYKESIFKVKE